MEGLWGRGIKSCSRNRLEASVPRAERGRTESGHTKESDHKKLRLSGKLAFIPEANSLIGPTQITCPSLNQSQWPELVDWRGQGEEPDPRKPRGLRAQERLVPQKK